MLLSLLLLLLTLCCSQSHARTYTIYNFSTSSHANDSSSPFPPLPPTLIHSNAATLASASLLSQPGGPVITSVSGCAGNAGGVTRGCNLSSYLTIAGSGFTFAGSSGSYLVIADVVRCSLFSFNFLSPAVIVASVCPYYYPANTPLSLSISLNGSGAASVGSAVSFTTIAPVLQAVTGCNVPPYGGCNNLQLNRLTIYGRNFLLSAAGTAPFFAVIINPQQSWPCTALVPTMTSTRFECVMQPFQWQPPGPPATMRFDGVVQVLNANWQQAILTSNVLTGAISFNEGGSGGGGNTSLQSSSSGGDNSRAAPLIFRVSGCVDVEVWTVECPYGSAVQLTLYGLNFQRALPSVVVGDRVGGSAACQPVVVSSDQVLRCTLDTGDIKPLRRDMLNVTVSTALGAYTMPKSVAMTDAVIPPLVNTITGCGQDGDRQTDQCTRQSEVRLAGLHFPRWLTPALDIAGGLLELPCQWRGSEVWVYCPLDSARLDELPKAVLLPIQVRFSADRVSDSQGAYLSIRASVAPPPAGGSSSGGDNSGGGDGGGGGVLGEDDLRGAKVGLFVLCLLSLVAIVVGVSVWLVGLWTAHRRAFVSANGQAAVDMRQVLLH